MKIFGIILMLALPIIGTNAFFIVLGIVVSVIAYEGARRQTVYGSLAVLMGIELIYGLDVGILSLSYGIAVLILLLTQRVVTVVPWKTASGWRLSDALRSVLIAYGLFIVMAVSGVLVGYFLYGYSDVRARLTVMFLSRDVLWALVSVVLTLIIARRIDEPFRRRIVFGI